MALAINSLTRPSREVDLLRFRAQVTDAICQLRCGGDYDEFMVFTDPDPDKERIINEVLAEFEINREDSEFTGWEVEYRKLHPTAAAKIT